ncbi:MAG TPA: Fic family protein [Limnobacter sp.]|nr:Fic family protein [Limnobacter sp.]
MQNKANIYDSLADNPQGLSLRELLALHPRLSRRTTQRIISELLGSGAITAQGAARSRKYLAVSPGTNEVSAQQAFHPRHGAFPKHIPISVDSEDILAYVDLPIHARKPVGYQREFLANYQPNKTAYLPATLRQQLYRIGSTSKTNLPAGTYSRAILDRLLIDLSWASSQLEGNTYSRLDTRKLIEHGLAATGKAALETQMILNHKTAIELLVQNIDTVAFDRYTIMNLHSALSENLLPNPDDEGRIRQHAVDIGKSVYRPLAAPQQIEELLDELLAKARQIVDPFEQSFFIMVHLPYLQPFADINKRTSRLAANLPLFRANLCPLTFLDVPEAAYSRATLGVYEMTRIELLRDLYLWAYERSSQEYLSITQELAEPNPLRLKWRELIKTTVRDVVLKANLDALPIIQHAVQSKVEADDQTEVQALLIEELRRLHEGVLARYGLRPSEYQAWVKHKNRGG